MSQTTAAKKKDLPFKDLVVDTRVGNVYLRELRLTNFVTGIHVVGNRVDLKPIALALNGAPIDAAVSVDLGSQDPGYDVALKMDGVPLAPIANSFAEEYRNRAKGDLNANIQIKGVGTTGATLKKSLQGQINLSCTNGQIELAGKKMRRLIDKVSSIPTLNLSELRTAPLTAFDANIVLGDGKIQIKAVNLISTAFTAHTEGAVPIANVLSNSPIPKLPVTFALSRPMAERVNLANVNADAPYTALPQFLFLTGTLGNPDTERNDAALAGIIARGVLPHVGGDAGRALGALLGGQNATNTSTNAPSTNKPSNLLDSLLKKKPK